MKVFLNLHCCSHWPHTNETSKIFAFHASTRCCLEPGVQILLRRLMLARRILAKHAWASEAMQRITGQYASCGTLGALPAGAPLPEMQPCPPCGSGSRSTWTAQAHGFLRPIGLLCSSLSEHRGCIRSDKRSLKKTASSRH